MNHATVETKNIVILIRIGTTSMLEKVKRELNPNTSLSEA